MKNWKRGSFTVEAAVIVPQILIIIALMIGLCFYVHQINWCKGAAYEAAAKSVERIRKEEDPSAIAKDKICERISEMPVTAGAVSAEVSGRYRIAVSLKGDVLQGVFRKLFQYQTEASLVRFEPVRVKRTAYLINKIAGDKNAD